MAHIQWKDRYDINYKEIDDQHKGLVGILNHIIDLLDQEPDSNQVAEIFHSLCQYALIHFATEERYMAAAEYPGLERHKSEHATFIERLLELNQAYESPDSRLLEETLAFVKEWYLNHIIQSDQEYAPCLKAYHAKAQIKGILFGFREVIGRIEWPRFVEMLAQQSGKTPEDLQALADEHSSLNLAYACGQMNSGEYLAQASTLCGCTFNDTEFWKAYTDVFTPNEATFELIRGLKPLYRLALIADTTPWYFAHIIRALDIFPLFDAVTLSFDLGVMRPDKALWDDALTKLNLMAEECICIDDRGPFALAATGHLMHGLAYTSHETLLSGLRRMKVRI